MGGILEQFACGNLNPNERNFRRGSEFGKKSRALIDAEKALRSALDEPQKMLLDSFVNAQYDSDYLERMDKFINGYRLGVLMTMEVFQANDELMTSGA